MSFQAVPNVAKAEMRYTQQGQKVENVFHFERDEGWTPTTLLALATALRGWWVAELKPIQCGTVSLNSIVITDLSAEAGFAIEDTTALPQSGSIATSDLPMHVTVSVKFISGLAGRSYRGRCYHVGLPLSEISGSTLQPAHVTILSAAYAELIPTAVMAGSEFVIVSRFTNNAARPVGTTVKVINTFVENILDSQRRRLPGRGA